MSFLDEDHGLDFPPMDHSNSILSRAEIEAIQSESPREYLRSKQLPEEANLVRRCQPLMDGGVEAFNGATLVPLPDSVERPSLLQADTTYLPLGRHGPLDWPTAIEIEDNSSPSGTVTQAFSKESILDATIPPIDNLPNELLVDIFLWCFPRGTEFPVVRRRSPLVLCAVCSRWKAIAHSIPHLWNNVVLRGPTYGTRNATVDGVTQWFSRSSNSLRTLHIHGEYFFIPNFRPNGTAQHITNNLILPNAPRLRELAIFSVASFAPHLKGPIVPFDALETLHLGDETNYDRYAFDVITVFNPLHLPSLRAYIHTSHGCDKYTIPMPPFIPWQQLTFLDLSRAKISMKTCWDVLFKCHRLTKCMLQLESQPHRPSSPTHSPLRPISFPSLQSFSIVIHGLDDCTGLLQQMTAPQLKEFTFRANVWSHARFMDFSVRSGFALECFLISTYSSNLDTYAILQKHPSLVEASFPSGAILSGEMVDSIVKGDVVPHIRKFSCGYEDTEAAIRMLRARSVSRVYTRDGVDYSISSLKSVVIRIPDEPTDKQMMQIQSRRNVFVAIHVETRASIS
jgi:hypothetical protein